MYDSFLPQPDCTPQMSNQIYVCHPHFSTEWTPSTPATAGHRSAVLSLLISGSGSGR